MRERAHNLSEARKGDNEKVVDCGCLRKRENGNQGSLNTQEGRASEGKPRARTSYKMT